MMTPMTEEEMLKMVCPMKFGPGSGGYNIQGPCIGSACAAWRWTPMDVQGDDGTWKTETRTHAFCGLAGPPQ